MKRRREGIEKPLPPIVSDTFYALSYGFTSAGIVSDEDVLATWSEYAERYEQELGDRFYDPRTFLAYWLAYGLDRDLAVAASSLCARLLRDGVEPNEDEVETLAAHELADDPRMDQ